MSETVGIVSSDEAPGYQLPQGFDLAHVPGVDALEVQRGAAGDRVVARFATPDAARLREAELRKVLHLTNSATLVVADSRKGKGPLWPQTLLGKIERLVAVAGVVLAVANYWSVFFGVPNVALQAVPAWRVVSGNVPEATFRVSNRSHHETTVDFESAYPMRFEPTGVILAPRQELTVTMRGTDAATESADVGLSVRARAGWLLWTQVSRAATRLDVWPRQHVGEPTSRRVYRNGLSLDITLPLRVGDAAPNGLACEAMLLLVPGVKVVAAQPLRELGAPQVNAEKGNELAFLSWGLPPLEAFTERSIQVFLESAAPRSEDEWRKITPRVECKRRS